MTASRCSSSNHAGGILGGISTGQAIVARFAVKPTSSILTPRTTVDRYGHDTDVVTKGRHDPCVGIRAVPIGEAHGGVRAGRSLSDASRPGRRGRRWPFEPAHDAAFGGKAVPDSHSSASKPRSRPSPRARSLSSLTTMTARTKAIFSSRLRTARRKRWRSSSAIRPRHRLRAAWRRSGAPPASRADGGGQ